MCEEVGVLSAVYSLRCWVSSLWAGPFFILLSRHQRSYSFNVCKGTWLLEKAEQVHCALKPHDNKFASYNKICLLYPKICYKGYFQHYCMTIYNYFVITSIPLRWRVSVLLSVGAVLSTSCTPIANASWESVLSVGLQKCRQAISQSVQYSRIETRYVGAK